MSVSGGFKFGVGFFVAIVFVAAFFLLGLPIIIAFVEKELGH